MARESGVRDDGAVERPGSPAGSVRAATGRWGEGEVVRRCASLLRGRGDDEELVGYLGGAHARAIVRDGLAYRYWPRVWAARGLLYAWDPVAAPAVVAALADDAWRVREMAAKVCRKREIGEAGDALSALGGDPTPRVRAAAARALGAVGEAEHAGVLRSLSVGDEPLVRVPAERALRLLCERLDRDLTTGEG